MDKNISPHEPEKEVNVFRLLTSMLPPNIATTDQAVALQWPEKQIYPPRNDFQTNLASIPPSNMATMDEVISPHENEKEVNGFQLLFASTVAAPVSTTNVRSQNTLPPEDHSGFFAVVEDTKVERTRSASNRRNPRPSNPKKRKSRDGDHQKRNLRYRQTSDTTSKPTPQAWIKSLDKPFRFLDLPLELRRKVYAYLIPQRTIIYGLRERFKVDFEHCFHCEPAWRGKSFKGHNLYVLSRQISEETLSMLYGENIFQIDWHGRRGEDILAGLPGYYSQKIKKICIFAEVQQNRTRYAPRKSPLDSVWSPILPNLISFQLVLRQPLPFYNDNHPWLLFREGSLVHLRSHTEKMEVWIEWVEDFLKFFDSRFPNDFQILVDARNGRETELAAVAFLGSKYVGFQHPKPSKFQEKQE